MRGGELVDLSIVLRKLARLTESLQNMISMVHIPMSCCDTEVFNNTISAANMSFGAKMSLPLFFGSGSSAVMV